MTEDRPAVRPDPITPMKVCPGHEPDTRAFAPDEPYPLATCPDCGHPYRHYLPAEDLTVPCPDRHGREVQMCGPPPSHFLYCHDCREEHGFRSRHLREAWGYYHFRASRHRRQSYWERRP